MKFDELKTKNQNLQSEIIKFSDNPKKVAELKRQTFINKVAMYDLILAEDKTRAGQTARDLIKEVKAMPTLPRFGTGIAALDNAFNGGFETALFIQLAGESGVGKTKLMLEIITNIAQGNKSTFFNFEMGKKLLSQRLQKARLSEIQLDNLWIDSETRKLEDLVMEIELLVKDGCKFFVIDSKMKIEVSGNEPTHEKISKISNTLAKLTQQRDIVIMLINQINEEDIKNKRLTMKGSGDQKYDSDIALFYVKDDKGNRKLICTKNRMDEVEFKIDLRLNSLGQTVGSHEPVITEFPIEII